MSGTQKQPWSLSRRVTAAVLLVPFAVLAVVLWVILVHDPSVAPHDPLTRFVETKVGGALDSFDPTPLDQNQAAISRVFHTPAGKWHPVVVIVPHEDDETLFLGETLAALDERGVDVTVIFTTTSQGGRAMNPRFGRDRRAAYWKVARILGVDHTYFPTIPDGAPLGGQAAKTALTEKYVRSLGVIKPGCVLFTIGGRGHRDHRIAEDVGRRIARSEHLPLYIYWGYGPKHKSRLAADKDWGPDMQRADIAGPLAPSALPRKRDAVLTYRKAYIRGGWMRFWVSIARFELRHEDQVGFVPYP